MGVTGVVGDLPPCWDSYRYVPIYLFQNRGFYMTQLYIEGNEYTVQVCADGKMPQDAMDYFDGLLLEACHTVVDLYQ